MMGMMMIIFIFRPHQWWWWWPCHSSLFMQWADVYRRFNQIPNQHSSQLRLSITLAVCLSDPVLVLVLAHHRSRPRSCRQTNYFRDGTKWGTSCQINPISCSVTKVWSDMGKAARPNFMDLNATPPRQHSGELSIFAPHVRNIFMWKIFAIIFDSQEIVRILGCGRKASSNCFPFFLDLSNHKNQHQKRFLKLKRSLCLCRSKQANIFQKSRNQSPVRQIFINIKLNDLTGTQRPQSAFRSREGLSASLWSLLWS